MQLYIWEHLNKFIADYGKCRYDYLAGYEKHIWTFDVNTTCVCRLKIPDYGDCYFVDYIEGGELSRDPAVGPAHFTFEKNSGRLMNCEFRKNGLLVPDQGKLRFNFVERGIVKP